MSRRRLLAAALAGAAVLPAASAQAVSTLPTVAKRLAAAGTTGAACNTAALRGAGLDSARYTAPMSGYLTVRLQGRGDWDLLLRDAAGTPARASQGFRGREVTQTWIDAGQTVVAEGCRYEGASKRARVSFALADVKPLTYDQQTASLVRVHTGFAGQQQLDRAGFDVTESASADWADVIANGDAQLERLKAFGAKYEVRVPDLGAVDRRQLLRAGTSRAAARSALPSGRTAYRTFAEIQAELKQIAADHQDLVRTVVLGTTVKGKEIQGLEIAKDVTSTTDGRPTFFLMGVHHAREWPSAEIAMEFAHLLTENPSDPRIASILANERVLIVPLVNPDGYEFSRGSAEPPSTGVTVPVDDPTNPGNPVSVDGTVQLGESIAPPGGVGAYRRKNCNDEQGAMTPCGGAYGVDNNRNYGNLWGGAGSAGDRTSQGYHGQAPRSENETQAVFDYVRTHHVTTLISLHTIAGLVLRPPGLAAGGKAPDEAALKALGDAMGAATGYVSQYSFQLYDTAGTTEDDTYAATGGYGYTIELGPSGGLFHGPYDTNVVQQWEGDGAAANGGMREALLKAAEVAKDPASHAKLTGTAPAGSVLRLHKDFDTVTSKYCLNEVDPLLNSPIAGDEVRCPEGFQDPLTLKDTVDFTTTVPADGAFSWQIGQSTRPFVNGGAEIAETVVDDTPFATFEGEPGTPGDTVDHEFVAPTDLGDNDKIQVHLTLNSGIEDYDIDVIDKASMKSVGTSGNSPGEDEEVVIEDPTPGATYIIRVTYFGVSTTGDYTITVKRVRATVTLTTGSKEAYTLTCETPTGTVLEAQKLVIDRGQQVALNLGCGKKATTDVTGTPVTGSPNCTLPNSAPTVNCQTVPTGTGSGGKLTATLRKATRRQNLKRILGRKAIVVRCVLNEPGTCTVIARYRGKRLAKTTVAYGKARSKAVVLRLSRKELRELKRKKGRITFKATGKGADGTLATEKLSLKIKR